MAKLTAKTRNALGSQEFAGPHRSYPVPDKAHAANAKARVANKSPALKARVDAKANRVLRAADGTPDVRRERNDPRPGDDAEADFSDALESGRYYGAPGDKTQNMNMPGGGGGRGPTPANASNMAYERQNGGVSKSSMGPTMGGIADKASYSRGTSDACSGMDSAMAAHADKLHPVRMRR